MSRPSMCRWRRRETRLKRKQPYVPRRPHSRKYLSIGKPIIKRADLGSKGVYYRAQIGPFSSEQARRECDNLKAAGGQCFVQSN